MIDFLVLSRSLIKLPLSFFNFEFSKIISSSLFSIEFIFSIRGLSSGFSIFIFFTISYLSFISRSLSSNNTFSNFIWSNSLISSSICPFNSEVSCAFLSKSIFSVSNDSYFLSFSLRIFLICDTSFTGLSTSLRLSYFSWIFLSFSLMIAFSCSFRFKDSLSWKLIFSACSSFIFNLTFSSYIFLILSSFPWSNLLIWETSFTGESISLKLSYLPLMSCNIRFNSLFSILRGSNRASDSLSFFRERISVESLWVCSWKLNFNVSNSVSAWRSSLRVMETSLTGESISRRLSYFSLISLNSFIICELVVQSLSFSRSKDSCAFWRWFNAALVSSSSLVLVARSVSFLFRRFLIWETSFIGESMSLKLSYFSEISWNDFLVLEISNSKVESFCS